MTELSSLDIKYVASFIKVSNLFLAWGCCALIYSPLTDQLLPHFNGTRSVQGLHYSVPSQRVTMRAWKRVLCQSYYFKLFMLTYLLNYFKLVTIIGHQAYAIWKAIFHFYRWCIYRVRHLTFFFFSTSAYFVNGNI